MPFKSKRQLQTCFGQRLSAKAQGKSFSWDCDKWLEETPNPSCLPDIKDEKGSKKVSCRPMRKSEKIVGPIQQGARGGLYFMAGGVKVYVPKDAKNFVLKNNKEY